LTKISIKVLTKDLTFVPNSKIHPEDFNFPVNSLDFCVSFENIQAINMSYMVKCSVNVMIDCI